MPLSCCPRFFAQCCIFLICNILAVFPMSVYAETTTASGEKPGYSNEDLLTRMLIVDVSEQSLDNVCLLYTSPSPRDS